MLNDHVRGADISGANLLPIWQELDRWDPAWLYIKATLWTRKAGHCVDGLFDAHIAEGRHRDKALGAYHWLDSRVDVREQVDHHWRTIEARGPWALRSMIDWEPGETYDPKTGRLVERWSEPRLEHAEQWVERYHALSGHLPVVYCGTGYLAEIGASSSPLLARCPLLVAQYPRTLGADGLPTTTTAAPKIWASAGEAWAAWQFVGTVLDRSIATPHGYERMLRPEGPAQYTPPITLDQIHLSDPYAETGGMRPQRGDG